MVRYTGAEVQRMEDPRLLTGHGRYVDDIKLPDMLYMDIVRSPYAHAKILGIDASAALEMEGVLAETVLGEFLDCGDIRFLGRAVVVGEGALISIPVKRLRVIDLPGGDLVEPLPELLQELGIDQ